MENTMTINLHATKGLWEDIKAGYIARTNELAEVSSEEIEALTILMESGESLSESVDCFQDLEYEELVKFIRASSLLADEFGWDPFDDYCDDRNFIAGKSADLAYHIQEFDSRLTLPQVKTFGAISYSVHNYLKCKPNKYQMEQFKAHGIEWDGDVRDH
tara:strand:+ start:89 stop:565 length:477 start_codon:yes stop_codon:yes gene_type:complete